MLPNITLVLDLIYTEQIGTGSSVRALGPSVRALGPFAMPPKSAGAARRARKAKTKQDLEEQGQSHPGYVDNPARPRRGRQDRQTRLALRSFNEQMGLELGLEVQRRPAGNQPSHFAKARSAVEVYGGRLRQSPQCGGGLPPV